MITLSHSENQTEALGKELALKIKPGDVIALYGSLGSGKTAFTRGICSGLNCVIDVHSPTFNIINFYPGEIEVAHIDLYRIDDNLDELGWDDMFNAERLVVVEWAEKAKKDLPKNRIDVYFDIIDLTTRKIEVIEPNDAGN